MLPKRNKFKPTKIGLCVIAILFTLNLSAQDITSNLVVHYPFDGNVADATTNGYDGTPSGVTLTEDKDGNVNSAYSFDGGDYIDMPNVPLSTNSFTFSFWMNRPVDQRGVEALISKRNVCNTGDWMQIRSDYISTTKEYRVVFNVAKSTGGFSSKSVVIDNIQPDEWTHITFVKDHNTNEIRGYKNGLLMDTETISSDFTLSNAGDLGLGSGNACIGNDGTLRYKGLLDDVRLYDRALTQTDISSFTDFQVNNTYPKAGDTNVSITSDLYINLNQIPDGLTITPTNINVTGAGGLPLIPSIVANGAEIRLMFPNKLPSGQEITVSLQNLQSLGGGNLLPQTYHFTTATAEQALLAHYEFGGPASIANETEEVDLTVYGNNAIYNGGPSGAQNRLRNESKAIYFDGSADFLTIADNDQFDFGNFQDFTISTWFKIDGDITNGTQRVIFNKRDGNRRLMLVVNSGKMRFHSSHEDGSEYFETTNVYDDGLWHHIAVVMDRDMPAKLYVDGAEEASHTFARVNMTNNGTTYIGALEDQSQSWLGWLDDFKAHNRTFTQAEIKEMAPIYMVTDPVANERSAAINSNIDFEFGQAITAATAIAANFTVTGSSSGAHTVSLSGADTRSITLDPTVDFELDETITVTYANLISNQGISIEDGSFTFQTASPHKGMWLFYPFDGNANNELSDTFDGVVNGASLATGYDGTANSAYSFEGSESISIGDIPFEDKSFSFAFWMKRDDVQADQIIFGNRKTCNQSNLFRLRSYWNDTESKYYAMIETRTTSSSPSAVAVRAEIQVDTWTHVTIVRDNAEGQFKIFIDGTLIESEAIPANWYIDSDVVSGIATGDACLGVDGSARYTGDLDEFRIYRRALSQAEITNLQNPTLVRPTLSAAIDDRAIDEDAATFAIVDLNAVFSSSSNMEFDVSSDNDDIQLELDGSNVMVTLTPDYFGTAQISVGASSGLRQTDEFTLTINSINDAPVIAYSSGITVDEDFESVAPLSIELTQPANESEQTTTFSISPETVDFATVNFNQSTGEFSINPVENGFGSQSFTVTADDGQEANNTSTTTIDVTVNEINDAPTFELASSSLVLVQNFESTQTVVLTNTQPENENEQNISYALTPASVSFATVSIDNGNGTISITAVADQEGSQTFTVTADDGQELNNTFEASFTLEVVNNLSPTVANAVADLSMNEDAGSTTIVSDVTAVFADPESDDMTFEISSDNNEVQVSLDGNAAVATSSADYFGSAVVTLTAFDGFTSTSDEFTLTINAVNDAPDVTVNTTFISTVEDFSGTLTSVFTVNQPANESDQTITYFISDGVDFVNASVNAEASQVEFTAVENASGEHTFTVTVSDGQSENSTTDFEVSINIAPVNDAPTIVGEGITDVTADEDANAITIDLSSHFNDAEGTTLSYIMTNSSTAADVTIEGQTLTITPIADAFGSGTVTIFASDEELSSVSDEFTITLNAVNDAPALEEIDDQNMTENESIVALALVATDVDNSFLDLAITVTSDNSTLFPEGSLVVNTNENTASLSITPATDQTGTALVTVTVSDGLLEHSSSFNVAVNQVLGLEDLSSNLSMYPNPTKDRVVIEQSVFQEYDVNVLNVNGQVIKASHVNGSKATIDLSQLQRGTYFIMLRSADKMMTKRLIKM